MNNTNIIMYVTKLNRIGILCFSEFKIIKTTLKCCCFNSNQ